jgi:hypothetical protein
MNPLAVQAGEWFADAGAQYARGNYTYDATSTNYYLYGGIRYQTLSWNFSLSIPLLIQNNNLVNRTGDVFFPTGGPHHGDEGGGMPPHRGMRNVPASESNQKVGLGDIFVSGEIYLFRQENGLTSLSLAPQVKIPTADEEQNFGTGKFDFGGSLNFRKVVNQNVIFADAGYLKIGDPEGADYRNPFIFGGGIGRFFIPNKLSALLYFQAYTEIVESVDPPRYGSIGLFYNINNGSTFSLIYSAGLSETSPDITLGVGYSHQI